MEKGGWREKGWEGGGGGWREKGGKGGWREKWGRGWREKGGKGGRRGLAEREGILMQILTFLTERKEIC